MPGFRGRIAGGCGVSGGQAHAGGHGHGYGHGRPGAGHMLTDVAGLSLALVAAVLAGNAVPIVLLSRISGGNLNTRAARLEVINDAHEHA